MPSFSVVGGAGTIKGVHVPHAEWVVPLYPFVLEVLQELVPIVKCWNFTFQPPPSHEKGLLTIQEKYEVGDYTLSELVKLGIILYINNRMYSRCPKQIIFRWNGTFALFVRRNGIRD